MKNVWQLTWHQLCGWRTDLRVSVAFLLGIGLSLTLASDFFSFAEVMQTSVQICEAYVVLGSSIPALMGILLGCFLLLADAPFVSGISPYEILRTGRRKWCISRYLYLIIACFLYSSVLLLFTMAFSFLVKGGSAADHWSETMHTLAVKQPYFTIRKYAFAFPFPELINGCSPCEAMLLTWLFSTLYMIFCGGMVLVVNLYTHRNMGWIIVLILHIIGYLAYTDSGLGIPYRFSLLCCAAPAYQFREEWGMSTLYCLRLFMFLNALLLWLCVHMSRHLEASDLGK